MKPTETVDDYTLHSINATIANRGLRGAGRHLGVDPHTLSSAIRKGVMSVATLSKVRGRIAKAEDFSGLSERINTPRRPQPKTGWDLEACRSARDAQARGDFRLAAPLALALKSDDALYAAMMNRVAPISAIGQRVQGQGARGESVAKKAAEQVKVHRSTLASIALTMAVHGIAIGYNEQVVSEDGTRIDMMHEEWPIEAVRWNPTREVLETRNLEGETLDVVHADGRWVIYSKYRLAPWTQEAALLPAASIFWAHSGAIKDWAAASLSHGNAKIVGELPEGIPVQDPDSGSLSPEAASFSDMIVDLASGVASAGIRPSGSKTEYVVNGSQAWQVFQSLVNDRASAAHIVFCGNTSMLGSTSSAPGQDTSTLFGVASTKVQGDCLALQRGLFEGVYTPWAALNFGDSKLAPSYVFDLPDDDAAAKVQQMKAAEDALFAILERRKSNGVEITQEVVDDLAERCGVYPAPVLAAETERAVPLGLAPTDVAKVVRVREARAAQGLPPLGDDRDDLTISQLDAFAANSNATPVAPAEAA